MMRTVKDMVIDLSEHIDELVNICDTYPWQWETKYDVVFKRYRNYVRPLIGQLGLFFDYYDPDTTYEEDTRALVDALKRLKEGLVIEPPRPSPNEST